MESFKSNQIIEKINKTPLNKDIFIIDLIKEKKLSKMFIPKTKESDL